MTSVLEFEAQPLSVVDQEKVFKLLNSSEMGLFKKIIRHRLAESTFIVGLATVNKADQIDDTADLKVNMELAIKYRHLLEVIDDFSSEQKNWCINKAKNV